MIYPASNRVNLDKVIEALESVEVPVFAIDLNKDEINSVDSFIVYNDKGDIEKSDKPMNYLREFSVMYVSKVNRDIEEIELIDKLLQLGLIFVSSNRDHAKFKDTDQTALVITINFKTIIRLCR